MKVSGVYLIINKLDGKYYIGESNNVFRRLQMHKNSLMRGDHLNIHLQRAVNKYGIEQFEFDILEECDSLISKALEHYWCILLNAHDDSFGYNIRLTSVENKAGKFSDKSRERMSLAKKGIKLHPDHVKKLSEAQLRRGKNQFRSEEARLSIATANKRRAKEIVQLDNLGNVLQEWSSRKEASNSLSIGDSSISNCLLGYRPTAGGYKWKFKN